MKKDLDSIILTRQELQIMKVVWDRGAATVKEVCDVISQKKATAYTTVLTLMGILEDKGALTHVRAGRAYIYKPLLSRQQATRNQLHDVLVRFFDGRADKMIENVLETVSGQEQANLLRNLLESRREHQVA
ncbi:MAG TPA: BlaI/MecI/CopY family transcriptional regulator [Acidobacteriota bacterium]|nr:BlaI/MecI/CopY family transcriptional regulator [Acidobacteriota bacterium]